MNLLLALLLAITIIGPAAAKPPEEGGLRTQVLRDHIDWITTNSNYEYGGEPLPKIRYVSQRALDRFIGDSHLTGAGVGSYDYVTDTLLLHEDLELESFDATPTVIHELVHYLQDLRGDFAPGYCPGRLEVAPYFIEEKWMDEHDHPGERVSHMALAVAAASCRGGNP